LKRRWLLGLVVIVLFIAGGVSYDRLQFRTADLGFRHATGLDLPANVTAVAHCSEMNDNLLHLTHYWELAGPRESLRALATKLDLSRSDEDAAHQLAPRSRIDAPVTTFGARHHPARHHPARHHPARHHRTRWT
jgi:hypothetical protein